MTTFSVKPNARDLIREAHFDTDQYEQYLEQRHVPDRDIQSSEIVVSSATRDMFFGSNCYESYATPDGGRQHVIELAALKLPSSIEKQGRLLRHETEHFIYDLAHPNHIRNRAALVATAGTAGAIAGALGGVSMVHDLCEAMPAIIDAPLTALGGIAGIVGGTGVMAVNAVFAHMAIGPSEIRAELAERTRINQLPDGVLQIEFWD